MASEICLVWERNPHLNRCQNQNPQARASPKHTRTKFPFSLGLTEVPGPRETQPRVGCEGPPLKPAHNCGGSSRAGAPCRPSQKSTGDGIQRQFSEALAALLIKSQSHLRAQRPVHLIASRFVRCVLIDLTGEQGLSGITFSPSTYKSLFTSWVWCRITEVTECEAPSCLQAL